MSVCYLSQEVVVPITRMYRLIPVHNGDAESLFHSLQGALSKDDIAWNKVIGFASDGENLMQEQSNSVLTQLREAIPDMFVLKCFCNSFHSSAVRLISSQQFPSHIRMVNGNQAFL